MWAFCVCFAAAHRGARRPINGLRSSANLVTPGIGLTKVSESLLNLSKATKIVVVSDIYARNVPMIEGRQLERQGLLRGQQMSTSALDQVIRAKDIVTMAHATRWGTLNGEAPSHLDGNLVRVAANILMARRCKLDHSGCWGPLHQLGALRAILTHRVV